MIPFLTEMSGGPMRESWKNVLQEVFCFGYMSPKVLPFLAVIMISVPVPKHSLSQEIAKYLKIKIKFLAKVNISQVVISNCVS